MHAMPTSAADAGRPRGPARGGALAINVPPDPPEPGLPEDGPKPPPPMAIPQAPLR